MASLHDHILCSQFPNLNGGLPHSLKGIDFHSGENGCLKEVRCDYPCEGDQPLDQCLLGILSKKGGSTLGDHHRVDDHCVHTVLLNLFGHHFDDLLICQHPCLDGISTDI